MVPTSVCPKQMRVAANRSFWIVVMKVKICLAPLFVAKRRGRMNAYPNPNKMVQLRWSAAGEAGAGGEAGVGGGLVVRLALMVIAPMMVRSCCEVTALYLYCGVPYVCRWLQADESPEVWIDLPSLGSNLPIVAAGDRTQGYLYHKIAGTRLDAPANGVGDRMHGREFYRQRAPIGSGLDRCSRTER